MEEKLQQLQKKFGDEESERKEMTILMSQMNEKQTEEKEKVSKVKLYSVLHHCYSINRFLIAVNYN